MLNIRLVIDYLLHRVKANNRHGIHSPFVYKLIDTVIYDFGIQKAYRDFENIGKPAYHDKSFTKPLKAKALRLLYRLICHFKPDSIINNTTDNGIDTVLKNAAPHTSIFSTANGTGFETAVKKSGKTNLILFNGDNEHQLDTCLQNAHDDTILIISGIYQNKNTKQAWNNVKTDVRVKVTIDLFYFGLVFFKPGMSKENFMVRY